MLDWIAENEKIKEQAQANFSETDMAFKLYNKAHPDQKITTPDEPKFSDFYTPSQQQKTGELLFVATGAAVFGWAAYRYL